MASGWLKQECPRCKYRNSEKAKTCTKKLKDGTLCGFNLSKYKSRVVWWIEWREGLRKPKRRIGPNKEAAEQELRKVLSALTEGRYIEKSHDATTRFETLAYWYLTLPKVKAKLSYDRDERSVGKLCAFFGNLLLKDITPELVEKYIAKRLAEVSYRRHHTKPATVNRELACMKTLFRKAIANKKAEHTPFMPGTNLMQEENNERKKVLKLEEYPRLIAECPDYIEPIVKLAYYTGMRRGEILKLAWDMVDLKRKGLDLPANICKNKKPRFVPLCPEMIEIFKAIPQGLPGKNVPVFMRQGKPITGSTIRVGLEIACRWAGIEGLTFHYLRRTAKTNMLSAGVDGIYRDLIVGHSLRGMDAHYLAPSEADLHRAMARYAEWLEKAEADKTEANRAHIGAQADLEPLYEGALNG